MMCLFWLKLTKFEWNFKYATKNVNDNFSFSIVILINFNKNYIIYIAVLPITKKIFWKTRKHLNLSQRILIESNLNENTSLR